MKSFGENGENPDGVGITSVSCSDQFAVSASICVNLRAIARCKIVAEVLTDAGACDRFRCASNSAQDMKSLTATLVLLALAGCSTDSQTWEFQPGVVTVRSIHGEAQYGNGGVWDRLRVNMDLTNGVQIRTGHDSEVTFLVGCSVGLKLTPDSELHFTAITVRHLVGWLETRTALELPHGTVLCVVKKLSPESSFQIRSGGFTVEVRKGDFLMSAEDKVEVVAGEITLLGGGKTLQLRSREYFDLKKNEIGRVPDGPNMWGDFFVDGGVTDYALVDFVETWPESPLSPYDYGLARARLRLP